jgi:hypothetical protein
VSTTVRNTHSVSVFEGRIVGGETGDKKHNKNKCCKSVISVELSHARAQNAEKSITAVTIYIYTCNIYFSLQ